MILSVSSLLAASKVYIMYYYDYEESLIYSFKQFSAALAAFDILDSAQKDEIIAIILSLEMTMLYTVFK